MNSVDNMPGAAVGATFRTNINPTQTDVQLACYFPRFNKYYRGTVVKFYKNGKDVILRIKNGDGDDEFINYRNENTTEGRDLKRLLENFQTVMQEQ